MKTLDDIKQDMSVLYDRLNNDDIEIKQAAELANICGKFLKAEQLQLARDIFIANSSNLLVNKQRITPVIEQQNEQH